MFIKFCGFTRIEDIEYAANLQISAAGFIFYIKSKRNIDLKQAHYLISALKAVNKKILTVGIFVDFSASDILEIKTALKLDYLQIYDHTLISELQKKSPIIIAYRINSINDFSLDCSLNNQDLLLLDAKTQAVGGAGVSFNWDNLKKFSYLNRTLIAGGLNENNIQSLFKCCNPFGIDISSGIENYPGIKSKLKMENVSKLITAKFSVS